MWRRGSRWCWSSNRRGAGLVAPATRHAKGAALSSLIAPKAGPDRARRRALAVARLPVGPTWVRTCISCKVQRAIADRDLCFARADLHSRKQMSIRIMWQAATNYDRCLRFSRLGRHARRRARPTYRWRLSRTPHLPVAAAQRSASPAWSNSTHRPGASRCSSRSKTAVRSGPSAWCGRFRAARLLREKSCAPFKPARRLTLLRRAATKPSHRALWLRRWMSSCVRRRGWAPSRRCASATSTSR